MATVRVVGRGDLASQVLSALKTAGVDAVQVEGGLLGAGAQDVDVAIGARPWDPYLWRLAKRRRPHRPLVAVADRAREGALRGATEGRRGPDGYIAWPGAEGELMATLSGAVEGASQPRTVTFADVFRAMIWIAWLLVVIAALRFGPLSVPEIIGCVALGGSLMLSTPYAWYPRWTLRGGFLVFALGVGIAVYRVMHP